MKPISKIFFAICLFASVIPQPLDLSFAIELPYRNEATRQLLIQSLKDEDRVHRVRAADDLVRTETDRNREALLDVDSDPVEAVRHAARGEPAPSPEAGPALAFQSGFAPRPRVEGALVTENHRDPRIRQTARLEKLDSDPTYREDFSKLLDDPDYSVRRAVSTQVIKRRGRGSIGIWQKLLASERLDDCVEAAWAVGRLNSKPDETVLLKFLDSDSERLRLISIESLQRVGGDAARQALEAAIPKHTAKTQEALLRLVAQLQAHPALPAVRTLAADKKDALPSRLLALDAIGALADAEAQSILLKIVTDYDPENGVLREHAARALGAVGGPEAVAPLKKLITEKIIPIPMIGLSYDNDLTRIACIQSLQQLKQTEVVKELLDHAFLNECFETMHRALAESLSALTGTAYDYRRAVSYRPHFIESLDPEEQPPSLAKNLRQPPVFPASAGGFKGK